jgi:PAS domain S-box-containing protein
VTLSNALAKHFAMKRDELDEVERQLMLYRVIADTCPLPVVLLSTHGDNIYVNKAYASMLRCQPTDLLGKDWEKFVVPDMLGPLLTAWGAYVSNPVGKFVTKLTFVQRETGAHIETHVHASNIPNDGFVAYVIPLDNVAIHYLDGHF